MYTLGQAAKAAGCSKATISRAIKNGKLSATRRDDKTYAINPAELDRWIDGNSHRNSKMNQIVTADKTGETPLENSALRTELEAMRQIADDRQKTIDDLRERLDAESEERRKLTMMLTDQRPKGFWARLTGK